MKNFLHDTWELTGNDFDEFVKSLRDLERATKCVTVNTADLAILSNSYDTANKIVFTLVDDQATYDFETEMGVSSTHSVEKSEINPALHAESVQSVGFLLKYGDNILYPAGGSMASLLVKCKGLSGARMYDHTLIRNLHLMDALRQAGISAHASKRKSQTSTDNCTLVLREGVENGVKCRKVFYFGSEKYKPIKITTLADMASQILDNPDYGDDKVVRGWSINHGRAEITFVFPALRDQIRDSYNLKDSILPGLILESSDTGEVCLTAKAVAFLRGSGHYVELEKLPLKHIGHADTDKFLEDANNMIFRNYRKLPELLCSLMEKSLFTGRERSGQSKRRVVEAAYVKCINGCYYGPATKKAQEHRTLKSILGDAREKELREQLFAEIDPDAVWTYYDIVMNVMSIADRIAEMPASMVDVLPSALAKAPYVFESLVAGGDSADDGGAILMA